MINSTLIIFLLSSNNNCAQALRKNGMKFKTKKVPLTKLRMAVTKLFGTSSPCSWLLVTMTQGKCFLRTSYNENESSHTTRSSQLCAHLPVYLTLEVMGAYWTDGRYYLTLKLSSPSKRRFIQPPNGLIHPTKYAILTTQYSQSSLTVVTSRVSPAISLIVLHVHTMLFSVATSSPLLECTLVSILIPSFGSMIVLI